MKTDILFICDHDLNMVGGSQESMKIIIDSIKESYHVSLATLGNTPYHDKAIPHYLISNLDSGKQLIKHPFSFFKYIFRTKKIIDNLDPKIIHTQEQLGFFLITLLKRLHLIEKNICIVHTERGLYKKYSYFIKFIFKKSLKYTNYLITTTVLNKNDWLSAINLNGIKCKFVVIENTAGCLFEKFDSKSKLQSDNLNIGFAGRYCDWKGWGLAEKIIDELTSYGNIHFYISIGCLDANAKKNTLELFNRINNKIGDRLHSYTNLNIDQMNEFYYKLDIFILTSNPNTESFGRVLVEAMSRKVALLTTPAGGAEEVVGKKENICKSPKDFKDKILNYLNNQNKLTSEKEFYYKRFYSLYTLDNNIKKHKELYNHILKIKSEGKQ